MALLLARWRTWMWFLLFLHSSSVQGDRVKVIPGYGAPPTAHFSGFVEVDPGSKTNLFYYFVESQTNPDADPLIWWMNGGPGASSLAGLFAENGPLLLNEAGRFMSNPYAWNRQANVLYVEFGPGVGYSYCANSSLPDAECPQERGDCSPCPASDSSVARLNVVFIEKLLSKVFPTLAGRPLYLAGESYAGVYIPTLAAAIIDHFNDTKVANLCGLWVTDPCTDSQAQSGWMDLGVEFSYQHGLISQDVYRTLTNISQGCSSGRTPLGDLVRRTESIDCRKAWRLYDLATAGIGDAVHPREVPGLPLYIDPLNAVGPSGGADMGGYLGRNDVRRAFNAMQSPNKVYHMELDNNGYRDYTMQYDTCNLNPVGELGKTSMIDVYRSLVKATQENKAAANLSRIIICSGDLDPVVGPVGTEAAVKAIGFPVALGGERRPWFYNASQTDTSVLVNRPIQWGPGLRALDAGPQVGGFITNFNTQVPGVTFDFVLVRNAGHMVPAYAPQHSLHIIEAALLHGSALAPRLAEGFASLDDGVFYGFEKREGGTFTAWVKDAMSAGFIGDGMPVRTHGGPAREQVQIVV